MDSDLALFSNKSELAAPLLPYLRNLRAKSVTLCRQNGTISPVGRLAFSLLSIVSSPVDLRAAAATTKLCKFSHESQGPTRYGGTYVSQRRRGGSAQAGN